MPRKRKMDSDSEDENERRRYCKVCGKRFQKPSQMERHFRIHTGEKPFKCSQCDKSFNQKVTLQSHIVSQHEKTKPFTCELCNTTFAQKGNLRAHKRNVHVTPKENEKQYKCDECPSIYRRLASLNNHIAKSHAKKTIFQEPSGPNEEILIESILDGDGDNEVTSELEIKFAHDGQGNRVAKTSVVKVSKEGEKKVYLCNHCTKSFKKPCDLIRHLRTHTLERPYKCQQCSKAFAIKTTLTTHMQTHLKEKRWKCPFCPRSFSILSSLKNHQLATHNTLKLYKCPVSNCERSFKTGPQRRVHIQTHHYDEENLDLPEFNQGRRTLLQIGEESSDGTDNLNEEMSNPLKITNDGLVPVPPRSLQVSEAQRRKHLCPQCPASFNKSSHLKQHIQMHNQEKPFQCFQCGKRFVSCWVLKNHIRAHGGIRPYKCSVCPAAFSTRGSRTRHEVMHSDNRPYVCPVCKKRFKTNASCRKHIKIHKKKKSRRILKEKRRRLMNSESANLLVNRRRAVANPRGAPLGTGNEIQNQNHNNPNNEMTLVQVQPNPEFHFEVEPPSSVVYLPSWGPSFYITTLDNGGVENVSEAGECLPDEGNQYILSIPETNDDSTLQPAGDTQNIVYHESQGATGMIMGETVFLQENYILPSNDFPAECQVPVTVNTIEQPVTEYSTPYYYSITPENETFIQLNPVFQEGITPTHIITGDAATFTTANEATQDVINHAGESGVNGLIILQGSYEANAVVESKVYENIQQTATIVTLPHAEGEVIKGESDNSAPSNDRKGMPLREENSDNQTHEKISGKVSGVSRTGKANECSICQRRFQKGSDLIRHIRIHTGEKPFKCTQCHKPFRVKSTRDAHMRVHEQKKTVKCDICDKLFATVSSLKLHNRLHTGERPYECHICSRSFRTSGHKHAHMKTHSKRQPSKQNRRKVEQRMEQSSSTTTSSGPATTANYIYNNSSSECLAMLETNELVQSQLGPNGMKVLGNLQLSVENLQNIQITSLEDGNGLQTDDFFQGFILVAPPEIPPTNVEIIPSTVTSGVMPITKTDPFLPMAIAPPSESQIIFHPVNQQEVAEQNVTVSKLTSQETHPFQPKKESKECPDCGKIFARPSQMLRHHRIHTGVRPHVCSICRNTFSQKSSLDTHVMFTHSDVRPFQCPECPFKTVQKGALKKHCSRAHPELSWATVTENLQRSQ